jgi:hypothetical protein
MLNFPMIKQSKAVTLHAVEALGGKGRGKGFFPLTSCVQTGSGAHPAFCTMGTGVLSLGPKRGRGVTLTVHPHLVPR